MLNGASTIGRCLESVRRQAVEAEHVVVDGGSTDRTRDVVGEAPGRVRLLTGEDQGMYDAMNKGIAAATGDVVGILNADDVYEGPDVLARVASAYRDASVDCSYGDLVYVDDSGRVIRKWRSGAYDPRRFRWGWMPPHPTFFVRRRVYRELGPYRLDFGTAADYELMVRYLLREGLRPAYVSGPLVRMRTGGASNRSLRARIRANRMDRLAWEVNGLRPLPWTFLVKPLRKLPQYL